MVSKHQNMIVVTGAAGFIGSVMVGKLNQMGHRNLILVDEFSRADKNKNLQNKSYISKIDRDEFIEEDLWRYANNIDYIIHLGARTDTTEQDNSIFDKLNINYSKQIWKACVEQKIPLIYASSAATYGMGEHGYEDNHRIVSELKPMNPYGWSKNHFDRWALKQAKQPPLWFGLKFFNVYGPNEYHKGRMASVIFHTLRQIKATGGMKLFRSHRPDIKDGEQSRDFIYVKDVVSMMYWLMQQKVSKEGSKNGLYNIGTGKARTFYDLAANTFKAMEKVPNISFIDTPIDIRATYQYYTQANMDKLKNLGYTQKIYGLEEGIEDYVKNYLTLETIL